MAVTKEAKKKRRNERHEFMNHWASYRMQRTVHGKKYRPAYFFARMAWDKRNADNA